jgi:hypothetical protein
LTASRAARTAVVGCAKETVETAVLSDDRSTALRSDRPIESASRLPNLSRLARALDERHAEPRRRADPERRIGPGRHRNADQGEPEQQLVRLFARGEPAALAQRVANIAEHEQVAGGGAGEPDRVLRLASDETMAEFAASTRFTRSASTATPCPRASSTKLAASSGSFAASAAPISYRATAGSSDVLST